MQCHAQGLHAVEKGQRDQRGEKRIELQAIELRQVRSGGKVSGASPPPGFQLDAGVKAQGISASISEAGWPAAMASSVALR